MWYSIRKKLLSYKTAWMAFGFALALILFEEWFFRIDYYQFLIFVFTQIEDANETFLRVGLQILLVFMVTAGFVWAALVSRTKFKTVYFVLFTGIITIEYGYQNATDDFLALQEVYTALTSLQHWDEAVIAYVNWLAFVPILCFGILLWFFRMENTYGLRLFLTVLTTIVGLNIGTVYYAHLDSSEQLLKVYTSGPSISLPSFFRVISHWGLEQLTLAQFSRQTLQFQAEIQPNNNVIFILDESIRYDHLSLNGYERPTTSFLEQLVERGVLYNWGLTVAGATCSLHSAAMLLSGVNDLPDETFALRRWPSILQYAKAMNYTTHYIDGEGDELRFPLDTDDLLYVDHLTLRDDLGSDHDTDLRIAAQVATVSSGSTGNFVIVLKRGAHFPYSETFPTDQALWLPILGPKVIFSDDSQRLTNSYDNAINHNVDNFFRELLANPNILSSTVILYTSDHGQNLGEVEDSLIHCGKTPLEAAVPLFIISKHPVKADTTFKAAHRNVFATLLDLMNVSEADRVQDYGRSLLRTTAAENVVPRRYYYGPIFGLGEYGWVEFDERLLESLVVQNNQ